jgi:NitT/TauT family transport system permease protein
VNRPALLLAARLAPLVAFLAFWQWYCQQDSRRSFYYSTPERVAVTAWKDLTDGSLPRHTGVTLGEAMIGFVGGNLVGAVVGLALWYTPLVARVSKPYLVAVAAIPVFAIAPMTILWFGVGWAAKAILAFLATVFIAAAQAYRGAEQVDPLHLHRLRVFGAGRWRVFWRLLVPTALVWVIGSLRLTVGGAFLGAFIGEFIAAEVGLGYMITKAAGLYDTPRVLVGVIVIVLIAVATDRLIELAERRMLIWSPRVGRGGTSPGG